jgi:predicted Zn-dependent protease
MAGIIEHGRDDVVWLLETGFLYLQMGSELVRLSDEAARERGREEIVAARETFEGLVALEPEQASFHASLGDALRHEGSLGEARKALRRAVDLDPGHAYARCLLGDVLVHSKQEGPGQGGVAAGGPAGR